MIPNSGYQRVHIVRNISSQDHLSGLGSWITWRFIFEGRETWLLRERTKRKLVFIKVSRRTPSCGNPSWPLSKSNHTQTWRDLSVLYCLYVSLFSLYLFHTWFLFYFNYSNIFVELVSLIVEWVLLTTSFSCIIYFFSMSYLVLWVFPITYYYLFIDGIKKSIRDAKYIRYTCVSYHLYMEIQQAFWQIRKKNMSCPNFFRHFKLSCIWVYFTLHHLDSITCVTPR